MSKEYNEEVRLQNLKEFVDEYANEEELTSVDGVRATIDIIEEQLNNYKKLLNANPSEALECLEKITLLTCNIEWYKDNINTIKQALIKAEKEHNSVNLLMQELDCKDFADLRKYARCGYQTFKNAKGANYDNIIIDEAQEPKQYLKWEDLEFEHTPKIIDVKMNGNKYKLIVGYNVTGKHLAILRDGKKEYYFLECDKQFFNDLHLERVEE